MRVNIYAEEMSEDVEIISKETKDGKFTGLRLFLYLPVTLGSAGYRLPGLTDSGANVVTTPDGNTHASGKFMHHSGDDDSAAITFWGKQDLRVVLRKMLEKLDQHYDKRPQCVQFLGADDERCPEPAVFGSAYCSKHSR